MKLLENEGMLSEVVSLIGEGHSVTITVRGNSMRPLLCDMRDEVVLGAFPDTDLRPMAIVLFRYNGRYLLHRIIRREGNELLIRGDGLLFSEERATTADVCAIVTKVIINGKPLAASSFCWRFRSRLWVGIPKIFKRIYFKICG